MPVFARQSPTPLSRLLHSPSLPLLMISFIGPDLGRNHARRAQATRCAGIRDRGLARRPWRHRSHAQSGWPHRLRPVARSVRPVCRPQAPDPGNNRVQKTKFQIAGNAPRIGRDCSAFGHQVKLIAPQLVKPYVKRGRNDATDAEAPHRVATPTTAGRCSYKSGRVPALGDVPLACFRVHARQLCPLHAPVQYSSGGTCGEERDDWRHAQRCAAVPQERP